MNFIDGIQAKLARDTEEYVRVLSDVIKHDPVGGLSFCLGPCTFARKDDPRRPDEVLLTVSMHVLWSRNGVRCDVPDLTAAIDRWAME